MPARSIGTATISVRARFGSGATCIPPRSRRRACRSTCCTRSAAHGSSNSTSAPRTTRSSVATTRSRATSSRRINMSSSRRRSSRRWRRRRRARSMSIGVRPTGTGRSRVLGEGVLPGPRQGRRPRVPPAGRGAQGDRARGAGPVRGARAAASRAAPAAQRRPGDGAAALRRRSCGRRPRCRSATATSSRPSSRWPSSSSSSRRPTRSSPRSTTTTVRDRVLEAIQRKVDGQDITADTDARGRRQDHRSHGSAQGQPGPRQDGEEKAAERKVS